MLTRLKPPKSAFDESGRGLVRVNIVIFVYTIDNLFYCNVKINLTVHSVTYLSLIWFCFNNVVLLFKGLRTHLLVVKAHKLLQ